MPTPSPDAYVRESTVLTRSCAEEAAAVVRRHLARRPRARVQQGPDGADVVRLGSRMQYLLVGVWASQLPAVVTVRAEREGALTRVDVEVASDLGRRSRPLAARAEGAYRRFVDELATDLCDVLDGEFRGRPTRLRRRD